MHDFTAPAISNSPFTFLSLQIILVKLYYNLSQLIKKINFYMNYENISYRNYIVIMKIYLSYLSTSSR